MPFGVLDSCLFSRAWVEVDLEAMRTNVAEIARFVDAFVGARSNIMAVVKADAYGHGLLNTSRAVIAAGASWLGIATISEGAVLREANITAPIALLSAPAAADACHILQYGLTAMVGDTALLDALVAQQNLPTSEIAVHLDIDTGMGRSGVLPKDAVSLWKHAISLGIKVEGISTHFADADNSDNHHTQQQLGTFEETCLSLHSAGARFVWKHIDNSASIVSPDHKWGERNPNSPSGRPVFSGSATCNLVRPGLLIYGITPKCASDRKIGVFPALSLKARIATIRELPANHAIGYGVTHRLRRNSKVATVSIGYGDGYPRALSNLGHMLVRGARAPILGSVCMDQTVVDVTDIEGVSAGDEVVCIGRQIDETITVEQIAALINATEHEITTGLTTRLPRMYRK
jgi:alanine racemase